MLGDRLDDLQTRARDWLFADALPLWSTTGFDDVQGGFVERVALDGRATPEPRRAMVQARQVYAFSEAGALGWRGPWRDRAARGIDTLLSRYRMPDGAYAFAADADGGELDRRADLYTQAFVLFALAHAYRRLGQPPELQRAARDLSKVLKARFAAPDGGFAEPGAAAGRFSNPHMHLFEAGLAWIDASGGEEWFDWCRALCDLCVSRLIPPGGEGVRERFAVDWTPAPGEAGRIIEPGHQFEWSWLLERWASLSGEHDAVETALGLYELGQRGVCTSRRTPFAEVLDYGRVRDTRARLWPNTERLKAALMVARREPARAGEALATAEDCVDALFRYFETPTRGLFHDTWDADGRFDGEPARASSLYHIVCGFSELLAATATPTEALDPQARRTVDA